MILWLETMLEAICWGEPGRGQWGVVLVLLCPSTSIWLPAVARATDIHTGFGDNLGCTQQHDHSYYHDFQGTKTETITEAQTTYFYMDLRFHCCLRQQWNKNKHIGKYTCKIKSLCMQSNDFWWRCQNCSMWERTMFQKMVLEELIIHSND